MPKTQQAQAQTQKDAESPSSAYLYTGPKLLVTLFYALGSIFLIVFCPPLCFLLWHVTIHEDASLASLLSVFQSTSSAQQVMRQLLPFVAGNGYTWAFLLCFVLFEVILMVYAPGRYYAGPVTPSGSRPLHKLNGFASFLITTICFAIFGTKGSPVQLFDGGRLVHNDTLGYLIGATTVFAFVVSAALYVKGLTCPSSRDAGSSGNPPFDFYWGTELYPRIGRLQLKLLIHSRLGMMLWALLLISYLQAQWQEHGFVTWALLVNTTVQFWFVAKHFFWERGYLGTTDIVHDYEGYYLIFGCIVFMPFTFTISSLYLQQHAATDLPPTVAIVVYHLAVGFMLANYQADSQKDMVRCTLGKTSVWGKRCNETPGMLIYAKYSTGAGSSKKEHNSLLLCGGWWGIARHCHYTLDLLAVFFWTSPVGLAHPLLYFYPIFLAILFVDRAARDDARCRRKYNNEYGKFWDEYCERVPYRMIPYVW